MPREQIPDKYQGERTRCIVYTRVMGYHRPVESFNVGKTGEHKERKQFLETKANDSSAHRTACSRRSM